jgi:REP element-mobilizing transposase RayT
MLDKVTDKVGLDGLYEITNIDKPIKSVSAYKLDELVTMANHLNILVSVKRKKDIYDSITTYFKEIKLI